MSHVRYVGDSTQVLTTLGVELVPGEVVEIPEDLALSLGDQVEWLDARLVESAGGDALVLTEFVDTDRPGPVRVRRNVAGSATLPLSRRTYTWSEAGEAVPVDPADVEALLAESGFALDGEELEDPAVFEPVVEVQSDPAAAEPVEEAPKRRRTTAVSQPATAAGTSPAVGAADGEGASA